LKPDAPVEEEAPAKGNNKRKKHVWSVVFGLGKANRALHGAYLLLACSMGWAAWKMQQGTL